MKNVAIIPARGGSKRIPRKNIKEFLGKPIIAYSIQSAIESNLFDEVMVSTDDDDIASVANKYGANIPFRRSERNSDDFATTSDVLLEVLDAYKAIGVEFDNCCCLYPTAPFITATKLAEAFHLLLEYTVDSVIPIVKFSYPIQRGLKVNNENRIEFVWPENEKIRSQDFESIYHDAGQFYWLKIEPFKSSKSLISLNTAPIILSEFEMQDIDTESDWELAQIKHQILNKNVQE